MMMRSLGVTEMMMWSVGVTEMMMLSLGVTVMIHKGNIRVFSGRGHLSYL